MMSIGEYPVVGRWLLMMYASYVPRRECSANDFFPGVSKSILCSCSLLTICSLQSPQCSTTSTETIVEWRDCLLDLSISVCGKLRRRHSITFSYSHIPAILYFRRIFKE